MHLHRTAEVILWAFLSAFVAYAAGSCGTSEARDDAAIAHKLANHYRWQRDSTEVAQRRTDTITRVVVTRDARAAAQRDSLAAVLAYADSVLADSAASLVTLRVTLGITIGRVREYQSAVDSLQASTRELIAAHAEERFATNRTLALADSTIAAYKRVAETERRKRWHYRTQGAFVGGIAALLLVIAL
jgi:hypothetical protein